MINTEGHWQKIGKKAHHGLAVPLFSLRTQQSCGIGEFLDLIPLIDWCSTIHFDCIQLLPLNDTAADASPYNAISSCALDPIYISLFALKNGPPLPSFLNEAPYLMREEVRQTKLQWLTSYFALHFSHISERADYKMFISTHPWVHQYALFKALKERFHQTHWKEWPSSIPLVSPEETYFFIFLQYLAFQQMQQVKAHADHQKVFLQGDFPILVSSDSVDVWENPSLFHLDLSAGAPPDAYNQEGQDWGFPVFNWERLEQSTFQFWTQRLRVAETLYHFYRIDHIVGLFRIWVIPQGAKAKEGFFLPNNPDTWIPQGQKILEHMIQTTSMLPIAEDLGTIPKDVFPLLKNLGICGTKVVRWQTDSFKEYLPYQNYEPFSVTTVSTHDLYFLKDWWTNYPKEALAFSRFKGWSYTPTWTLEKQKSLLLDAHQTPSYFHINLLPEYLALFPELIHHPEPSRINTPGTLSSLNWTYRCRTFLETITSHADLQTIMRVFSQNQ